MLIIVASLSCTKKTGEQSSPQNQMIKLQIAEEYPLAVKEPSGLCLAWNADEFLTLSDNSNTLFRVDNKGNVLEEFPFVGRDIEGISYQEAGKIIWVVDEKESTLYKLNKRGILQNEYPLSYGSHPSNKGLEGITVNTNNNHIFMLNEASPGLLLEYSRGEIIKTVSLDFAKDYSGIFFDKENNFLWIVSDESKGIYKCNLNGKLLQSYQHDIDKVEGIVVGSDMNEFWVCSDSQNTLYKLIIKNK